jgi:hypothetical protein
VKGNYHVIDGKGKAERTLAAFCRANGQLLLPLVELVEQARLALDTVVEQVSQQIIETILQLSADGGRLASGGRCRGAVTRGDRSDPNPPPSGTNSIWSWKGAWSRFSPVQTASRSFASNSGLDLPCAGSSCRPPGFRSPCP